MATQLDPKNYTVTNSADGVTELSYSDEAAFLNGTEIPEKQIREGFKYTKAFKEHAASVGASLAADMFLKDKDLNAVVTVTNSGPNKSDRVINKYVKDMVSYDPKDRSEIHAPRTISKDKTLSLMASKSVLRATQQGIAESLKAKANKVALLDL